MTRKKKILIFDLDATLTEECFKSKTPNSAAAYYYILNLLLYADREKYPVYVITSRDYSAYLNYYNKNPGKGKSVEDLLLTEYIPSEIATLLRKLVGKRHLYFFEEKGMDDAQREGYEGSSGGLKMYQIQQIQQKHRLPYSKIIFFDDASHNLDAWHHAQDSKNSKMGAMWYIGGKDKCVFNDKTNRESTNKFLGVNISDSESVYQNSKKKKPRRKRRSRRRSRKRNKRRN